jgi:hypothetical protein
MSFLSKESSFPGFSAINDSDGLEKNQLEDQEGVITDRDFLFSWAGGRIRKI